MKRQSIKEILKGHFHDTSTMVYGVLQTVVGAAVIHYGILPYLASVHVLPADVLQAHQHYFQTLATLISLRLLKWTIFP